MADEQIMNPELLRQQELMRQREGENAQMMQAQMGAVAGGVPCPKCGTINEPDADYCALCGAFLHTGVCPNCGSEIDPDADFCEACHHYIRTDVCSFCGASFSEMDAYCPECGQPRGGIVCPACHTLNDFSFCKQCGRPLTEQAREMLAQVRQMPEYKALVALAQEYDELQMQLPYETEADKERDEELQDLRRRVLTLLAEDVNQVADVKPTPKRKRVTKEELQESKNRKLDQIAELLSRLEIPADTSPARVRNYAMAQKPSGVRLAWVCNYKQALHSSPCGCAKPQMGGKWVILGHNSKQEIKDDK
jgi:predicted amidophosphoribosyltransferase